MNGRFPMLRIRTPEGIEFPLRLAGPVTRFLAWALDFAVIAAVWSVVSIGVRAFALLSPDTAGALQILLFFALSIGYGIWLEWRWDGRTIGKRVLRLRVMDERGLRLRFSQVVIRNLLRFVDSFPVVYLVGGISLIATRLGQRLGDLAANTIVVRTPRIEPPDVGQITAGRFNSLREHPHLEARLRQVVPPASAALALQAVLRRDEFEDAARVALFAELAAHLKAWVPMPPELTQDLTDEQYVRNALDSIYRTPEVGPTSNAQHRTSNVQ